VRLTRRAGDSGSLATIRATVTDAVGTPITGGPTVLRVATRRGEAVAEHTMIHEGDGVWAWTPGPDDLEAGTYVATVATSSITLPSKENIVLDVIAQLPVPAPV
jgi:hypothetical protein